MQAKHAIPILNEAISELESIEVSWKNCRACPHSGKCCDNAFINVVFPEEAKAIAEHLKAHPEKLVYAKERASRRKRCYFHNPHANECLIHSVRPILCRWTPYTATTDNNSVVAWIRDKNCNFTPVSKIDLIKNIKPGIIEIIPFKGAVRQQKFLHLQGIEALHPLLRRAHEAIDMDAVLALSLEKINARMNIK